MQPGGFPEDNGHAFFADPPPEINQVTRVARQLLLEFHHPAELLPIRVFLPAVHDALVAL